MLSVVVDVPRDEPALLDTLSALVPGVADGIVRDVLLVAPQASDFVRDVADASGCKVLEAAVGRPARIAAGSARIRSNWVLALEAGFAPGGDWIAETDGFLAGGRAGRAVFTLVRRASPLSALRVNAMTSLLGRAHPHQGLLAQRKALAEFTDGRAARLAAPIFDRRGKPSQTG